MNRNDSPLSPKPRTPNLTVQGYAVQQGGQLPRRIIAIQQLAKWKNDPEHEHRWLCKLLGSAFQDFVIMALPGAPAAEMLPVTAQLWVEVLADMTLQEELDSERLKTAIRKLLRKLKEWPQIANLLEELPNRETAPVDGRSVRTRSVEEEAQAANAMAEMRASGLIK